MDANGYWEISAKQKVGAMFIKKREKDVTMSDKII